MCETEKRHIKHPAVKMKIVLIRDHQKKLLEKNFSNVEKRIGIVSLEKIKNGGEFTIRLVDVNHIRYSYDPKTQKFEVHFISLNKSIKKTGATGHEKIQDRF